MRGAMRTMKEAASVSVGDSPVDVDGVSPVVPGGVATCREIVRCTDTRIALGYMTAEESLPVDAVTMSLRQLPTDQILDDRFLTIDS